MSKAKRKYLSLTIEFTDMAEVKEALRKISQQVAAGRSKYNRDKENTAIYEWAVSYVDPEPYEERLINGQWCQVYQSKMNEK